MTLEDIRIEYKPLRVGFCIRNGNIKDLISAMKLNTLLWGGINNPIIPIEEGKVVGDNLVKLFQVDVLIPIEESAEIINFINKFKWAQLPSYQNRNSIFAEDSYEKGKKRSVILDVSHIFRKLWQKDFKFSKNDSNCVFVKWISGDKNKNTLVANFGTYPREKLVIKYENDYRKALRAKEVKLEKDKKIPAQLSSVITPISLTKQDIESYGRNFPNFGFFLGGENNFLDLVNFWNLRACGGFIIFLPKENIKRFSPYIKACVNMARKNYKDKGKFHVPVFISDKEENDYKNEKTSMRSVGIKDVEFGFRVISSTSWNGKNLNPSHPSFNSFTTIANIGTESGGPSVGVQLLNKPFLKSKRKTYPNQYFAVSIRPPFGIENSEYTTNLPALPDLNEWYSREMIFEQFGLRAIRDVVGNAISLVVEIDSDTIQFRPIEKFKLIKKLLERSKIEATKSGAGLIAERLIALMDGVNSSTRIFKITGVRKFITETSPLDKKSKHEIIEIIRDKDPKKEETFKKFKKEFGLRIGPTTPENVFRTMTEKNLLKAGVEIKCPKCGITNWISLRKIDESYECEFCFEKSKFLEVVKTYSVGGKKIDGIKWSYCLSGLLGKGDKQQGAIPVILTLLHLSNRMHLDMDGIYNTGLELDLNVSNKKEKVETDLLVLDLNQRLGKEDIEILIGECKTKHSIENEQIEKLVKVKNNLDSSGIKCYIVFSTLKEKFSKNEIKKFKKLYKSGIKPILLTVNELEPWQDVYRHYKDTIKNFKLPFEYPFTFEELAQNSAYIYELSE